MSARAIAFLVLLAIAAIAIADQGPMRRPASPKQLPPGPGRTIAERGCLLCHSAMLITQQRKDSTGWEKTLGQMELWGAPVAPGSRDTLISYLRRNFGVDQK